jgi:hypothetical protein
MVEITSVFCCNFNGKWTGFWTYRESSKNLGVVLQTSVNDTRIQQVTLGWLADWLQLVADAINTRMAGVHWVSWSNNC